MRNSFLIAIFFGLLCVPLQSSQDLLVYYGNSLTPSYLSQFDVIVLESEHYQKVETLRSESFAYISLGEVSSQRKHFSVLKEKGLLGDENPNWKGSYQIKLEDDHWAEILNSQVLNQSRYQEYDGFFLDTVDSLIAAGESVDSIRRLLESIREAFPEKKLFLNRAMEIWPLELCEYVLAESTISTYNFQEKNHRILENPQKLNAPESVTVFSLDYWDLNDFEGASRIYAKAREFGYKPLVSQVDLLTPPRHLDQPRSKVGEIHRRLLCLYNTEIGEDSVFNKVHEHLEVVLNYFGYFCRFERMNSFELRPDDAGLVLWSFGYDLNSDQLAFYRNLKQATLTGKPILWIGSPSVPQGQNSTEVATLLWDSLGFRVGSLYYDDPLHHTIKVSDLNFSFESELNDLTLGSFQSLEFRYPVNKELLVQSIPDGIQVTSVFRMPWGIYAQGEKVFKDIEISQLTKLDGTPFEAYVRPTLRWRVDPFEMVSRVFPTDFPVPDPSTLSGKRIAYLHIDGDGANSRSEVAPHHSCAKTILDHALAKYPMKIGVSFVGADLDDELRGNPGIHQVARDIFKLAHVEMGSHTYTHPLSWSSGISSFAYLPGSKPAVYEGIVATQAPGAKVHLSLEFEKAYELFNRFSPGEKKVMATYYSGDCEPTLEHLDYMEENGILAFNGGDSRMDQYYNSIAYLRAHTRELKGRYQIYSSSANENSYTDNWTRNFWSIRRLIEFFKRTGEPRRLKALNFYYHFYIAEKRASLEAFLDVYQYIYSQRSKLNFVFPSEYIKIVKEFLRTPIKKTSQNQFEIKTKQYLNSFRIPPGYQVQNESVQIVPGDSPAESYLVLPTNSTQSLRIEPRRLE